MPAKIRLLPDVPHRTTHLHLANAVPMAAPDPAIIRESGLDRAIEFWTDAAGDRDVPAWRDLDLMKLPARLRRGTMIADHHPDRHDYFIRYWGDDLVTAFGIELSQQWLSEADHNGVMNSFSASGHKVIDARQPEWMSHAITSPGGIRRIFPVVRLPLICPDTGKSHVMTVENVAASLDFFATHDARCPLR